MRARVLPYDVPTIARAVRVFPRHRVPTLSATALTTARVSALTSLTWRQLEQTARQFCLVACSGTEAGPWGGGEQSVGRERSVVRAGLRAGSATRGG